MIKKRNDDQHRESTDAPNEETIGQEDTINTKKQIPKSKTLKRGNRSDKTTKTDMACDYIRGNPNNAERLGGADLARIVDCDPSLLSRPGNKSRIQAAKAQAHQAVRDMARGFSTDDHQVDAEYKMNWDEFDDQIDAEH